MFIPMDAILDPWTGAGLENYSDAREKIHTKSSLKLLFDERDMNWIMSMIFYCERADTKPLLYFSAVAGAAFGSIHCAAWNFDFPSRVERIMWRAASLALIGVCLSIFLGDPIATLIIFVRERAGEGSVIQRTMEYLFSSYADVAFIPIVMYPLARLTLLILALLSLRNLSDSALQTVTWTKFVPHI